MIPFFIVATACISVFFSIWSHPDGPQWAREHGQLLLSNANRVRLGIESRTSIKLLPPPPLETTYFEPGSLPLSRETYVLKTSEAGLRPSTVGLALVSVFTVAAVSLWLVRRIRLVRLWLQSSRHIPECRLPVHRPPPTFLVTRDSAEAVDGPPPPQPALEFFESDVGVVADDQLSSQDTEFDYPVNPWSDQAVYVEEMWSDPILSEEELSSWEDQADDWSMVKRTDPTTRFGPEPQSTWAQLPLMLPAGLEPATSDFNNLAPVCLVETLAATSTQDALPELRKGCRVYADEEEARVTMQKAVKRIIREQLELDPSSIAVPKGYRAPPVIPIQGPFEAPGSHSVPSTPSRSSNTPVGTVSTGNKKNRRRGGRWKRQLAAAMAAEIASGNSGYTRSLAELDADNLDPTIMRLVDTSSTPATTDTEASF